MRWLAALGIAACVLRAAGALALPLMVGEARAALPPQFVLAAYGHFTAGGLVAIRLSDDVRLEVDGEAVPSHRGMAVFGYDRDRSGMTQLRFIGRRGKSAERKIPLAARQYDVQRIDGIAPRFVEPPPEALPRIRAEARRKAAARRAQLAFWPRHLSGRLKGASLAPMAASASTMGLRAARITALTLPPPPTRMCAPAPTARSCWLKTTCILKAGWFSCIMGWMWSPPICIWGALMCSAATGSSAGR